MSATSKASVRSAPIRTAIFGASGTTGAELTKLVLRHPRCELVFATSRSYAGQSLRTVDPGAPDVVLRAPTDVSLKDLDLAFLCLPHGHSATIAESCVRAGVRTIDLSGDLRLADHDTHARVYGTPRSDKLAEQAVYGLSELARDALFGAELVTNPGCYPTCVALGLAPLAQRGWLRDAVVINALSGVSGAGRSPAAKTHFCAVADDVRPYALGRSHRHVAEIEQLLARVSEPGTTPPHIIFNPHVVPVERGMLATMVTKLSVPARHAHERFVECYRDCPLIDVLPYGEAARIRRVVRTPRAALGIHAVADSDHVVITSAIDNLLKGAASQALHNMNILFELPETAGLD